MNHAVWWHHAKTKAADKANFLNACAVLATWYIIMQQPRPHYRINHMQFVVGPSVTFREV